MGDLPFSCLVALLLQRPRPGFRWEGWAGGSCLGEARPSWLAGGLDAWTLPSPLGLLAGPLQRERVRCSEPWAGHGLSQERMWVCLWG